MTQTPPPAPRRRPFLRYMVKTAKVLAWSILAVALAATALVVCTVKLLKPEYLTSLSEKFANEFLDADVSIGRLELDFDPHFPILRVTVDDLTVVSRALGPRPTEGLPVYADSLLSVRRFGASVDLAALVGMNIKLHDIEIVSPQINLVIAADGTGNYEIFPTDTTSTGPLEPLPEISLDHFRVEDPRAIRYYNAADSTSATIVFLQTMTVDGDAEPEYRLEVDGDIDSPLAHTVLDLRDLTFSLGGSVRWQPSAPGLVTLAEMRFRGAFVQGVLDAAIDFTDTLTVNAATLRVESLSIAEAVAALPEAVRTEHHLQPPFFRTDACVNASVSLTRPYVPMRDTIPFADFSVEIPPSSLVYGQLAYDDLTLGLHGQLRGEDLDLTRLWLDTLNLRGRATAFGCSGEFANIASDPEFRFRANGDLDLGALPVQVRRLLDGAVDGRLSMNLIAHGRASMFTPQSYQRLNVQGQVDGRGLYYLRSDTSHAVSVNHLHIDFGNSHHSGVPTLRAAVAVDSIRSLLGGVGLDANGLRLGFGIQNSARSPGDSTIVPMGGAMAIERMSVLSITDSAGMRMRNLAGRLTIRQHGSSGRIPEIELDANIGRLSAGAPDARLMLSDAALHATAHPIPDRMARRREIRRLADSLAAAYPNLPPDSVYALAVERRRARHHRRQRLAVNDRDQEVIDWGITRGFRTFLTDWDLDGTLSTNQARIFTPYFPLRNRFRHLDLTFSTDTIRLRGVEYKVGHSDISAQGVISDIARSLTRRNVPLKVNLDFVSDTIDVNQLAAAVFAGAAYAAGPSRIHLQEDEDFDRLEQTAAGANTLAPVLIPVNIEARIGLNARNIYYSDLHMSNFGGEILAYDGAVNLNNLTAASDAGSLALSALYSAPRASDIKFGMSIDVRDFIIERFLSLIPALDSIMPMIRDFSGTLDADIAATVDIDSAMNLELPTLTAAVHLRGDSLAFIDPETYRIMGKWLRFRDRSDNHINHMSVQLLVRDNQMQIFPFEFNIDRYRLGISGHNDLAMNFDYHIAVLKSPLPFKFGINIKGNPDHYKIRLGRARFNPGTPAEQISMIDTARVNLVRQISEVFRRGVRTSRFAALNVSDLGRAGQIDLGLDSLTHADSLALIREGMIPAPDTIPTPTPTPKRRRR